MDSTGTNISINDHPAPDSAPSSPSILPLFEAREDLLAGDGAPEEKILEAEKRLGLRFAPDFREYLSRYGIAAFDGHELTGISSTPRLSVTEATLREWKNHPQADRDLYVIEDAGIDGIVLWQRKSGEIYLSVPGSMEKRYHNLAEYLLKA